MRKGACSLYYVTCTDINTLSQTVAKLSLSSSSLKWGLHMTGKPVQQSFWVSRQKSSQFSLTHSMLLESSPDVNLWKQIATSNSTLTGKYSRYDLRWQKELVTTSCWWKLSFDQYKRKSSKHFFLSCLQRAKRTVHDKPGCPLTAENGWNYVD